MGYAISWIALRNRSPEQAAKALGLSPTGETEEAAEGMFAGALLETGWYVVVINEYGHRLVEKARSLSLSGEVIVACIEEHVMASSAEGWKLGLRQWSISHQSDQGINHLEEKGTPPKEYHAIKARLLSAQEGAVGVDYVFDVPLELAEAIVGYKHDNICDVPFAVLEEKSPGPSDGLFGRLFGKK